MSLRLERAEDDKGRVSAGIPGLSPERRRDITEYQLRQVYQRTLQAEYKRNEDAAVVSDNGMDVTDPEQMTGIPLAGARIIGRLKKLNHNLWFERSNADPNKTGIYLLKNDFRGGIEKQFLCGMETEVNTEFSVRLVDQEGNAKGVIPGWRQVLSKLIRARIISESGAFAMFGPPSRDSENWARFTQ